LRFIVLNVRGKTVVVLTLATYTNALRDLLGGL
jgi:hypothetical protein